MKKFNWSENFKRIYNNKDYVNKKIEEVINQWEKEDYEKINQKT